METLWVLPMPQSKADHWYWFFYRAGDREEIMNFDMNSYCVKRSRIADEFNSKVHKSVSVVHSFLNEHDLPYYYQPVRFNWPDSDSGEITFEYSEKSDLCMKILPEISSILPDDHEYARKVRESTDMAIRQGNESDNFAFLAANTGSLLISAAAILIEDLKADSSLSDKTESSKIISKYIRQATILLFELSRGVDGAWAGSHRWIESRLQAVINNFNLSESIDSSEKAKLGDFILNIAQDYPGSRYNYVNIARGMNSKLDWIKNASPIGYRVFNLVSGNPENRFKEILASAADAYMNLPLVERVNKLRELKSEMKKVKHIYSRRMIRYMFSSSELDFHPYFTDENWQRRYVMLGLCGILGEIQLPDEEIIHIENLKDSAIECTGKSFNEYKAFFTDPVSLKSYMINAKTGTLENQKSEVFDNDRKYYYSIR